jgi:hypothetical protein
MLVVQPSRERTIRFAKNNNWGIREIIGVAFRFFRHILDCSVNGYIGCQILRDGAARQI